MGNEITSEGGRVLDAIEAIYAAAAHPAGWPAALHAIAACSGDVGALLIYQRDDGSVATLVSAGLEEAQRDYEQNGWWRHDLRFSRSVERGYIANLETVSDRHLATPEEIENHPFYAQFLRSHGLKWFAGAAIAPDPHVGAALAIQRAADRAPFSDQELGHVARLSRHVENALRLGIRLINAEIAGAALADALSRLRVGVFLLDRAGRIVFSNAAAERLIGDGLLAAGGRLTAQFARERAALESAIARTVEEPSVLWNDSPAPVIVHGFSQDTFLAIYVLPTGLSRSGRLERLLAEAKTIVVVTQSQRGEPPDPTIVRDLLGLTLSEARLAALIGSGLPPRESAEKLGISEETARTTLKRVFEKVGVSRQSDLAALLARLVLG